VYLFRAKTVVNELLRYRYKFKSQGVATEKKNRKVGIKRFSLHIKGGGSCKVSMYRLNPPLIQAKDAHFVAINVLRSFSENLVKLSS